MKKANVKKSVAKKESFYVVLTAKEKAYYKGLLKGQPKNGWTTEALKLLGRTKISRMNADHLKRLPKALKSLKK